MQKLFEDCDFPPLSGKPVNQKHTLPEVSFKSIVKNSKVTFNLEILKRKENETMINYFNRLKTHFKSSTLTHTYDIFLCKKGNRQYRVAARDETIAKLLCQMYENKYLCEDKTKDFAQFKLEIYTKLEHDEMFYYELLDLVEDDKNRIEEAIKIYYNNIKKNTKSVDVSWLVLSKCLNTKETLLSEERILN